MTTIELAVSILEGQLKAGEQILEKANNEPDLYSKSYIKGYIAATKSAIESIKGLK